MGIHISKILRKPKTIKYWRKATKDEIKFGYGATHYRDFDFESCFDEDGFQKDKVRASDDKLIYYYTGLDCITNLELKKLIVI